MSRKDLYLWRKLNGFCVACRAYLPDDHPAVHCNRCRARQRRWAKQHKDRVQAKSARWRASNPETYRNTIARYKASQKTLRQAKE